MTTRKDFTTDQWTALVDAAPAIARAVAWISGSGRQSEDELGAFLDLLERTADDGTGGLLGEIVAGAHGRVAGGWPAGRSGDALVDGLEAARRAGAVLAVVSEPAEAGTVRAWLITVARTVADAAREGGVLGFGAVQVSLAEQETIAAIAEALEADQDQA